jgi:hypothetical protein
MNPDGLELCLECGNPIPKLTDVQWRPIVTVMQPTSAMTDENPDAYFANVETVIPTEQESKESLLSKLREWLSRPV